MEPQEVHGPELVAADMWQRTAATAWKRAHRTVSLKRE